MDKIKRTIHVVKHKVSTAPKVKKMIGAVTMIVSGILLTPAMTTYANLETSIPTVEDPALNLAKQFGRTAFFIILIIAGGSQYLGREFSQKGKILVMAALAGTAVVWNAGAIRDFAINTFGG